MCPVQSSGERVPYVPGLHPQHCALVSPEAVGYFDFHLGYCGESLLESTLVQMAKET